MRYPLLLILLIIVTSCSIEQTQIQSIVFSGNTSKDVEYLILGNDTILIENGIFNDTVPIKESLYDYVQLSNWKWPKLIYLDHKKDINIDFSDAIIELPEDKLNHFLLNSDSILIPYTLKWDMKEEMFRNSMNVELETNFHRIDSLLLNSGLSNAIINELKTIEKLKVAHRTANFISFQERKLNKIDRSIYDFMEGVDLNNPRLEKQLNNRNFQYYYLLDKISEEVPDSIYPFAVIDTVNKYSSVLSIRKMIISSIVKSSFYNEEVNHNKLITVYGENFGTLNEDDELFVLQSKIQSLQSGNKAPSIGQLESTNGKLFTIEDLIGNNILLTVWGTWCPYCKEELSALKNLINKYPNHFTSVGISFDKNKDKWKAHIKENDWQGIHLIDSERNSAFKSNYLINGTNVHLLIDKEGNIVSSKTLKPSSKHLEELIAKMK